MICVHYTYIIHVYYTQNIFKIQGEIHYTCGAPSMFPQVEFVDVFIYNTPHIIYFMFYTVYTLLGESSKVH